MKKILSLILVFIMIAALAACGSDVKKAEETPDKTVTEKTAAPEKAKDSKKNEKKEDTSVRYSITAYTANGQTYRGQTIKDAGMEETYLILNSDKTGYVAFSGEGMDIEWDDDGNIKTSGVTLYTFKFIDDDTVELNVYDTLLYTLVRDDGKDAGAAAKNAEKQEETSEEKTGAPKISGLKPKEEKKPEEKKSVEEKTGEKETEEKKVEDSPKTAAPSGNEPAAKGDGKASEKDVLRLMKFYDYNSNMGVKMSYEDMVKVVGVEGLDGGNDGPNSMTQYGDRIISWYIGDTTAHVTYTFRRPDSDDVWTACQWMSQNIDRAVVDATDISDLLPKADLSSMKEQEKQLTAFMTDIVTNVKFAVPAAMWIVDERSDDELRLYNTAVEDNNAPRITIKVQSTLDRINFYLDSFENLADIESRTIGGLEMTGRTYDNIGFHWTEYYAELPNSCWVSVSIIDISTDAGSEGEAVLNSISFK